MRAYNQLLEARGERCNDFAHIGLPGFAELLDYLQGGLVLRLFLIYLTTQSQDISL